MWRARSGTVFAVLAIALALIVLGALLLVNWNLQRVLARVTTAAELSIFLADDASSEQRGGIEAVLDRSGSWRAGSSVRSPTPARAFRRRTRHWRA
jgi:cell division protein FtsX